MKKIVGLAIFLLGSIGLNAQEISTQEEIQKKKEINQIKLGEQAMYADVVEVASDDFEAISQAQQRSINMLQTNVIEACAKKMNMSKKDVQDIFDIIDDKCQNVVIKKGDMLRVFSYIAKDAIGLGRKKASKEVNEFFASEESDSLEAQKATEQAMNLVMGDNETINEVQTKKEEVTTANPVQQATQAAEQAAMTVGQTTAATNQTVVVVQQPTQTNTTPAQTIVVVQQPTNPSVAATVVEPVPTPVPTPAPKPAPLPEPVPEVSVPELCQTMMDKGNMNDLMRFLNQEKRYQRLMYGNSAAMQYPEKCYIVIIDKASRNIVSVLDKGHPERMNFVSKKMDRYSNYRGGNYAAIFIQEY